MESEHLPFPARTDGETKNGKWQMPNFRPLQAAAGEQHAQGMSVSRSDTREESAEEMEKILRASERVGEDRFRRDETTET